MPAKYQAMVRWREYIICQIYCSEINAWLQFFEVMGVPFSLSFYVVIWAESRGQTMAGNEPAPS